MKIHELQKKLKNNERDAVYYLCGTEEYLQTLAQQTLRKGYPLQFPELNLLKAGEDTTAEEMIQAAKSVPFMDEFRLIFADAAYLDSAAQEKICGFLPDMPETSIFVLRNAGTVDKRNKLDRFMRAHTALVDCSAPKEDETVDFLCGYAAQRLKKLSRSTARTLCDYVRSDLYSLLNELDKLICVCGQEITEQEIKTYCVPAGEYNIFLLHDLMLQKKLAQAKRLTEQILQEDKNPIGLLSILASNFELMLIARACADAGYTAQRTRQAIMTSAKVSEFRAKKALEQAPYMTCDDIRCALKRIASLDYAAKQGGVNLETDLFGLLNSIYFNSER